MSLMSNRNGRSRDLQSVHPVYKGKAPDIQIATVFNNHGKHAYHPWRYFIAAGESLKKIHDVIDDAQNLAAIFKNYAGKFGADDFSNLSFKFPNASVSVEPESIKYRLKHKPEFINDKGDHDNFYPDVARGGQQVKEELVAIGNLPQNQRAQKYQELARAVGALTCDGQHFQFDTKEPREKFIAERKFRLKSNPAFITHDAGSDVFEPDRNTDDGFKIWMESLEINYKKYPDHCYAQWLGVNNINTNPDGHPRFSIDSGRPNETQIAQLEKIGEQWIIKVPVLGTGMYGPNGNGGVLAGYQESWVLPPDARPITISSYFKLLEDSGALSQTPGSLNSWPKP